MRQVCPHCKTTAPLHAEDRRRLGIDDDAPDERVAAGQGCEHCFDTGYRERTGIFELLEINEVVRKLIVARSDATAIKQAALQAGMSTLRRDAVAKLLAGQTTVAEVLRVTQSEGRIEN